MSTAFAGMIGVAPTVLVQPVQREPDGEQAKYEKMWSIPEYRNYAPGEEAAQTFLQVARPSPGDKVIDFGAGTGRGALMLALFGNVDVTMVDFAENCLDEDVRNCLTTQSHVMHFHKADLRKEINVYGKYGYCTDVMEHIPPEDVLQTLSNILRSAQHCFFQISLKEDHFGSVIGEHLHLTVKPYEWWLEQFKALDAVINWTDHNEYVACFYVTAWQDSRTLVEYGVVNTDQETRDNNVRSAVARRLQNVLPHSTNDIPVMILAGGPSMGEFEDEIIQKRKDGMKLITVNGAYNWAVERGLKPSAQIMVDSREFNKRFLEPVVPDCKYLLASQCHPSAFDAVPAEQTFLWHCALSEAVKSEVEAIYAERKELFWPLLGGSSVMLRALPLLRTLGYRKYDIYGFDSCLMGGAHHAYEQKENDNAPLVVQVLSNGRQFSCHPWMLSQAQEFLDLMTVMAEDVDMAVHGDGLIAWLIKAAATDEVELEVVS